MTGCKRRGGLFHHGHITHALLGSTRASCEQPGGSCHGPVPTRGMALVLAPAGMLLTVHRLVRRMTSQLRNQRRETRSDRASRLGPEREDHAGVVELATACKASRTALVKTSTSGQASGLLTTVMLN
jgi:hypothetical protein